MAEQARAFAFEYPCDDKVFCLTIVAPSEAEARRRVRCMALATCEGEIVEVGYSPTTLDPWPRLATYVRNMLW